MRFDTPRTVASRQAWNQLEFFYKKDLGYAIEMSNRPRRSTALFTCRTGGLDD